jgi:hypothetical protein
MLAQSFLFEIYNLKKLNRVAITHYILAHRLSSTVYHNLFSLVRILSIKINRLFQSPSGKSSKFTKAYVLIEDVEFLISLTSLKSNNYGFSFSFSSTLVLWIMNIIRHNKLQDDLCKYIAVVLSLNNTISNPINELPCIWKLWYPLPMYRGHTDNIVLMGVIHGVACYIYEYCSN